MATKSKSDDYAIQVKNLHKSYQSLEVLKGIDFRVGRGTVLALLGPNGAGKTTTVRILSTLLKPDDGTVLVNGFNISEQPGEARASIGLTGQYSAVDEYLTGRENLFMVGRLYHMSVDNARTRTEELLQQFDLVEPAGRPVRTYSGGMKRRLDLAMSLIASPPIIFLDEPTTGLDPRSRISMWEMIRQLVAGGTTVLLTTQYMEEADQLADEIVVIDDGRVIAEGTPDKLKSQIGADRLEFTIGAKSSLAKAAEAVADDGVKTDEDTRVVSVAATGGIAELKKLLDKLEKADIKVDGVELRRPTLDDVFLSLTGHDTHTDSETESTEAEKPKKSDKKKAEAKK
jgi:ABC-2 type transport system ATP-binding protein